MTAMYIVNALSPDGPAMRRRRGDLPPPRRPRVNAYRLAKFAHRVFNDREAGEWRDMATRDWRDFMERRFTLSEAERATLASLDDAIVEHIAQAVRQLAASGGALHITLPEGKSGGRVAFLGPTTTSKRRTTARKSGSQDLRFTVPIVDCSFDAHCRNWRCRAG